MLRAAHLRSAFALVGLVTAAHSGCAQTWDWVHPLENPVPIEFSPASAASDDRGRLWAAGGTALGYVVVRYDDIGAPARLVSSGENVAGSVRYLVAGKNGEMLGLPATCVVTKYGADDTYRWTQHAGQSCLREADVYRRRRCGVGVVPVRSVSWRHGRVFAL